MITNRRVNMKDLCGPNIEVGQGYMSLKVKTILKLKYDVKVIFLTQNKKKLQVTLPYRYFGYGSSIKKGELYNLIRTDDFIDNNEEVVETYQLTSVDEVKNFNLYYQ
jgi:hypothetical protein